MDFARRIFILMVIQIVLYLSSNSYLFYEGEASAPIKFLDSSSSSVRSLIIPPTLNDLMHYCSCVDNTISEIDGNANIDKSSKMNSKISPMTPSANSNTGIMDLFRRSICFVIFRVTFPSLNYLCPASLKGYFGQFRFYVDSFFSKLIDKFEITANHIKIFGLTICTTTPFISLLIFEGRLMSIRSITGRMIQLILLIVIGLFFYTYIPKIPSHLEYNQIDGFDLFKHTCILLFFFGIPDFLFVIGFEDGSKNESGHKKSKLLQNGSHDDSAV